MKTLIHIATVGMLVGASLALAPPAAYAANGTSVEINEYGLLTLNAAPGVTNAIWVTADDQNAKEYYLIYDNYGFELKTNKCSPWSGYAWIKCPIAEIERIHISLGDFSDTGTVSVPVPSLIAGGAGNDRLYGGSANDSIFGLDGDDYIEGGDGHDQLSGDNGKDHILGGRGQDKLINGYLDVADGADTFDGGSGRDSVSYERRTRTVEVDLDGVADDGYPGEKDNSIRIEVIYGGAGPDILRGNASRNIIIGNAGNDSIFSGEGDDDVYGGPGKDSLTGAGGRDRMFGGDGDDSLWGFDSIEGNDTLMGEAGTGDFCQGDAKDTKFDCEL